MNAENRGFNKQVVNELGELYEKGQLVELRSRAISLLDLETWEKNPEELNAIATDPEPRHYLVEVARDYVDASKTLGNRSLWPQAAIGFLMEAVRVVNVVYQNEEVKKDDLVKEMERDKIKTADAAANLEWPWRAKELRDKGSEIMDTRIVQLTDGDKTKNLMIIERELRKEDVGEKPDWEVVREHFNKLVEQEKESPHRVGTVAMWLAARGRNEMNAKAIFEDVMKKNPKFDLNIEAEKKRGMLKFVKQNLFWIPAMLTTSSKARAELRQKIMEW